MGSLGDKADPTLPTVTPRGGKEVGSAATMVFVRVLIILIELSPSLATHNCVPSPVTSRPRGFIPTGIVVTTFSPVVESTLTLFELKLLTYIKTGFTGFAAIFCGFEPTGMRVKRTLVAILRTLTLLLPLLTTKSFELSKLTAKPLGEVPTAMVVMTVLVTGLITVTELLPPLLT